MKSKHETPLTAKEQVFAADNHYLIERYLRMRGLPVSEWYDIVVLRYVVAVKRWFALPELHKYKFSTIAYGAMRSAVINEFQKRGRRPKTISLYDVIPGTENLMYIDSIADPADYYGNAA